MAQTNFGSLVNSVNTSRLKNLFGTKKPRFQRGYSGSIILRIPAGVDYVAQGVIESETTLVVVFNAVGIQTSLCIPLGTKTHYYKFYAQRAPQFWIQQNAPLCMKQKLLGEPYVYHLVHRYDGTVEIELYVFN